MQLAFFTPFDQAAIHPPPGQLLKWIGNKQRFAAEIVSYFPRDFRRYYEPFVGSGAVLATLAPARAVASDTFAPLIEIWKALIHNPSQLKEWYADRWELMAHGEKVDVYEKVKAAFNAHPNGADLLFLCRACYGGVVRFRKADGYMSTPCGVHEPISPLSFSRRVDAWRERVRGTDVRTADYRQAMAEARSGDLIYCDPPYSYSQSILYGAQKFDLQELFREVAACKKRGAYVAVSLDGTKKSGELSCALQIPAGLFERELAIDCGRSMLKRFQREGQNLEDEQVSDRLLLTY
jgi:DNA adenine methylase